MKEFIIENLLAGSTVSFFDVAIKLFMALVIGATIYIAYYFTSSKVSYNSNFNLSLVAMAIITTAIMAVITNNIALSLGMVGALSIVRFRTAIKNPMDLLFLFWSIGTGIICGAGLFEIAVVVALTVTVGILLLEFMPAVRKPYLLIINGTAELDETEVMEVVSRLGKRHRVCSRNQKKSGIDMIIEVNTTKESELLSELGGKEYIEQLSLLSHEGEVRV